MKNLILSVFLILSYSSFAQLINVNAEKKAFKQNIGNDTYTYYTTIADVPIYNVTETNPEIQNAIVAPVSMHIDVYGFKEVNGKKYRIIRFLSLRYTQNQLKKKIYRNYNDEKDTDEKDTDKKDTDKKCTDKFSTKKINKVNDFSSFYNSNKFLSEVEQSKFYLIEEVYFSGDLKKVVETFALKFPRIELGTATTFLPVKLRFARSRTLDDGSKIERPFNFSLETTLGQTLAIRQRCSKYRDNFIAINLFAGLSSIGVSNSEAILEDETKSNYSSFSFGAGLVYEGSQVQAGIYWGQDRLGGDISKSWVYQGRTWWSIGLGYQFLRKSE